MLNQKISLYISKHRRSLRNDSDVYFEHELKFVNVSNFDMIVDQKKTIDELGHEGVVEVTRCELK